MPGTVLLLAASPVGKGRLVDAASVLPVLAAVPPGVLAGTDTANVVELADPLEPQAVLTRLRAAAAAPGPLTLFVTGQLLLDRRQHLPHLALARTTPATVRYTGLPWQWLRDELRLRAPGTTTFVVDLHADAESWAWLREHALDCGRHVAAYGRVAPPPGRRAVAVPTYMRTVATILRSGVRPPVEQLHQLALARIAGEGEVGDLVLAPAAPTRSVPGGAAPRPPFRPERPRPHSPDGLRIATAETDPHSAIAAAVQAGRHADADALAARWEQAALASRGPGSDEALHWMEVRADLAMFAGDAERSCRTWLAVAGARLAAGQAADAPPVEAAVDRAHHQWGRIQDASRARELGPALAELRGRVPGRRQGALDHVHRQLRQLQTQGSATP
ncbi:hypothetical protein [Streptomyces sp. NPDC018693]|uniref:hypothetical protein n=1 Tax=unclassified Streptomyces TaxID=2593676 RepID=UPI0037B91CDF